MKAVSRLGFSTEQCYINVCSSIAEPVGFRSASGSASGSGAGCLRVLFEAVLWSWSRTFFAEAGAGEKAPAPGCCCVA